MLSISVKFLLGGERKEPRETYSIMSFGAVQQPSHVEPAFCTSKGINKTLPITSSITLYGITFSAPSQCIQLCLHGIHHYIPQDYLLVHNDKNEK